MAVNIIYAHPKTKGHCSAILSEVIKNLKSKRIKYNLIDLYERDYNPVLRAEEHYTAGNRKISTENKRLQKLIKDEKNMHMIFIYPLWWGQMPAILKGFIDRVFVPHYAFKWVNGRPVGLLKGKRAIVFTTSGGPSILYLITRLMTKSNIFYFCGISSKMYHLGNAREATRKTMKKIAKMVRKGLSEL